MYGACSGLDERCTESGEVLELVDLTCATVMEGGERMELFSDENIIFYSI